MSFSRKKVSLHINSILTETKRKRMLASIQSKSEDTCDNSKWGLLRRTNSPKLDNLIQMCSANEEDLQNSEKSNF